MMDENFSFRVYFIGSFYFYGLWRKQFLWVVLRNLSIAYVKALYISQLKIKNHFR